MAENHTENCSPENQKSLTDTRYPSCHAAGMDKTKYELETLIRLLAEFEAIEMRLIMQERRDAERAVQLH